MISLPRLFAVALVASVAGLAFAAEKSSLPPVPEAAAQKMALDTVRDLFKEDYAKAKTPAQQVALSQQLLKKAADTKDDPAGRYVLLAEAQRLAVQGGDSGTIMSAASLVAESFSVDALAVKAEAATKAAKVAKTPADRRLLLAVVGPLADEAAASDRYDFAKQLADLGLATARLASDPALVKSAVVRVTAIKDAADAHASVKNALIVLEAKPSDPEANLAVGSFRCFAKGDWITGLPMLALGSDPALKILAQKELAGPTQPADLVAVADEWWALGEKKPGTNRQRVLAHAADIYRMALPKLTGLVKDKVEKRLASAPAVKTPGGVAAPGGEETATTTDVRKGITLTFQDEKTVRQYWTIPDAPDKWEIKDGAFRHRINNHTIRSRFTVAGEGTVVIEGWNINWGEPKFTIFGETVQLGRLPGVPGRVNFRIEAQLKGDKIAISINGKPPVIANVKEANRNVPQPILWESSEDGFFIQRVGIRADKLVMNEESKTGAVDTGKPTSDATGGSR